MLDGLTREVGADIPHTSPTAGKPRARSTRKGSYVKASMVPSLRCHRSLADRRTASPCASASLPKSASVVLPGQRSRTSSLHGCSQLGSSSSPWRATPSCLPVFTGGAKAVNAYGSAGDPHRLGLFPSSLARVARACSLQLTDQLGSIAFPTSTATPPNKELN
jgi:hypothetical protein